MKRYIISLSILMCSASLLSQNIETSKEYEKITLDGKVAYMNLHTGAITSKIPGSMHSTKVVGRSNYTNSKTHIVLKGETLYVIARKYNVSVNELKSLNSSLDPRSLRIGQEIVVNATETPNTEVQAAEGKEHIVKTGETLYGISRKYGISVSELKKKNNLTRSAIAIGQVLRVK